MNFTFYLYEFALDYKIKFKYIALNKINKVNYKLLYNFNNVLEEDFYLNLQSFLLKINYFIIINLFIYFKENAIKDKSLINIMYKYLLFK